MKANLVLFGTGAVFGFIGYHLFGLVGAVMGGVIAGLIVSPFMDRLGD